MELPHVDAGRARVVIEHVTPAVEGGRFPVKRTDAEPVDVEADVFADGHDVVRARLRHVAPDGEVTELEMEPLGNDRWRAIFVPASVGTHRFGVEGWVDAFATWRQDTETKRRAGQDVDVAARVGEGFLAAAADRAVAAGHTRDAGRLRSLASALGDGSALDRVLDAAGDASAIVERHPDRSHATSTGEIYPVFVQRERARFSAWYELFPRSASPEPGRHGTLRDVAALVPSIAEMGFDVLYLPPIHPIGESYRKGPNNAMAGGADAPGSPWAIGSSAGGHRAVHPELGSLDDFRHLVRTAEQHGLEVALDLAFHCSPDHPYVREHPEWFRMLPDGSIQYAENPPKRYQDIYPFDFETDAWPELWAELRAVVEHWIAQGVRIFRVDNPHTKPFAFWTWFLSTMREEHPDVLFLSEAFTRPRVLEHLAKIGFTQSYTYFTWRTSAPELREYFEELTATDRIEYLRANLWPNTPDILTAQLQEQGRPTFLVRGVLAATLAASYGVYGPAFELCEHEAREAGSEEYLDSEKYQLRTWDRDAPGTLRPVLTRLNRIRAAHPALQSDRSLHFHDVEGDGLLCYSKRTRDRRDVVLCVVNVEPTRTRRGLVHLDLAELGLDHDERFVVRDLLGGGLWEWQGPEAYVELDPYVVPAHVFTVEPADGRPAP